MKLLNEYKTTTNRSVYNKARKHQLERKGDIRCTWCKYHDNENSTNEWYRFDVDRWSNKFPNWKLTSKNKKQWMPKGLKFELHCKYYNQEWYSISW